MYGAYHGIVHVPSQADSQRAQTIASVLDSDGPSSQTVIVDIVGSICENRDKFAVQRELPAQCAIGDFLIVEDSGAHGIAMYVSLYGCLMDSMFSHYLGHSSTTVGCDLPSI